MLHLAAPAHAAVPQVDPYQSYVAPNQEACHTAVAQAGVKEFRDMVLARIGGNGAGYIVECSNYEHEEGRAWDWMMEAGVPAQAAKVEKVLNWLVATDEQGNPHALARRLGLAYIIWNCKVISFYSSNKSWHPYEKCPSSDAGVAHTNHVHFAFSWAGARRQTTWFTTSPKPANWYPDYTLQPEMIGGQWGDFNGDGKPDFAAVTAGQLWIHSNASTPGNVAFAWSGAPVSTGLATVSKFMLADVDGDGRTDLIGFNGGHELMMWRSLSTGTSFTFSAYQSFGPGWDIFDRLLPMADFDGDGKPDFAALAGGDLWIHRNASTPGTIAFAWSGAPVSTGLATVSKFGVEDMDGDGRADLIGFNHGDELMMWRSLSTSTTFAFAAFQSFGRGWSIFDKLLPLADYNGDGKPDFAAVAVSDLWIHRNTSTPGNITFAMSNAPVSTGWATVSGFAGADVDADGRTDLVGLNGGDQFMIWRSLSAPTSFAFSSYLAYGSGWSIFDRFLTTKPSK